MSIYVGASNAKKEAAQLYLGRDGTKKEVSEAYTRKNGVVSQVYSGEPDPGQQVFTTSGTFTVPKGVKSIDVFLVGGGGKGSGGYRVYNSDGYNWICGGGGGGGYTMTKKGISVIPGDSINVVIGAGGTVDGIDIAYQGGTTTVSKDAVIASAAGGYDGRDFECASSNGKGRGGSGGGSGARSLNFGNTVYRYAGNGGCDGNNGYGYGSNSNTESVGGIGQGTTTRAFGEPSGTLYAGGGGGGADSRSDDKSGIGGSGGGGKGDFNDIAFLLGSYVLAKSGSNGTGGGGGGSSTNKDTATHTFYYNNQETLYWMYGANGGSGAAIIRWGY